MFCKKIISVALCAALSCAACLWAQDKAAAPAGENSVEADSIEMVGKSKKAKKPKVKKEKVEYPIPYEKFFVTFNYGGATTWVTRIKEQETRSNFVFEDFLVGAYFTAETRNLKKFKFMDLDLNARLALYYPLSYKFNEHPQLIAQPLAFGADVSLGPLFHFGIKDVVFFNLSPGVHYLFQKSDRWLYSSLGGIGMVGVEMPLAQRWAILVNGFASYDYANLGQNWRMEPYDYSWQYQVSLGVRYSKKGAFSKSYIGMIKEAVEKNKAKKAEGQPKAKKAKKEKK